MADKKVSIVSKEWDMDGKSGFTPYLKFESINGKSYLKKLGEKLTPIERDLINESATETVYLAPQI